MTNIFRGFFVGWIGVFALLLLSGCAAPDPVSMTETLRFMTDFSQKTPPGIERLPQEASSSNGAGKTGGSVSSTQAQGGIAQTDIDTVGWTAAVIVKSRRVNIRSGPGLGHQPVTIAKAGTSFKTYGKTAEGWWRICCFQGVNDAADRPTQPAWVSAQVVKANADAEALSILKPLFPPKVDATWNVAYRCASDRCVKRKCTATVTAKDRSDLNQFWLVIDREVNWAGNCGQDSVWRHQLDPFDGRDVRSGQEEIFLTDYWRGANPGPGNGLFTEPDGRKVAAWCNDHLNGEVQETGGWLNTYEGVACYDLRTGTLLSMRYVKRWLFSGEYAGQEYNRAYLGDFEIYEVKLNQTNIELAFQPPLPRE